MLQSEGGTLGKSAPRQVGVGGLLAVYDDAEEDDYVYLYDANGNVGQLVAWASGYGGATGDEWHAGRLVAHYEYDPYGGVVNDISGYAYAEENPYRFSTKYWDDDTGLGYWGERYYDPRTGRWTNHDPLEEAGGLNLYAFVVNDPTGRIDPLGLQQSQPASKPTTQGCCCCCCAGFVDWRYLGFNVKKPATAIDAAGVMDEIEVDVGYYYQSDDVSGDCRLEWSEWSKIELGWMVDGKYVTTHEAGVWKDIMPGTKGTFTTKPWLESPKAPPCDVGYVVTLPDKPQHIAIPGESYTQILKIVVHLHSALGCDCEYESIYVALSHTVVVVNGTIHLEKSLIEEMGRGWKSP